MSPEDQLAYESRTRTRQMTLAALAGILLMVATIIGLAGPHSPVSEQTLNLITEHRRGGIDLLAAIINALADVAVAATLIYLWRCAGARTERDLRYIPAIVAIGALVAVIAGIGYAIEITSKANTFVSTGAQTYDEANRLTSGAGLFALQIGGQLASLLTAIGFVLVCVQAMRVGLLPRVLAYVGMVAGALFLFPIIVVPIVQLYWLLAVAYLVSGRWPSGVPPAWNTGRAEAWPSSAEMRAQRVAAAEANRERRAARKRGGRVSDAPPAQTTNGAPPATGSDRPAAAGARPASASAGAANRKRKRKRRR